MKKTNSRVRYTARRRRAVHAFNHYEIAEILNTGLDKCKTLADLRERVRRTAADESLWKLVASLMDTDKARDKSKDTLRKHMETTYGGKRK